MFRFRFQVKYKDKEVIKALKGLQNQTKRPRLRVMRAIGGILVTSIKQNFLVQGRYRSAGSIEGGPRKWQPNAVATLLSGPRNKRLTLKGTFRKPFIRKLKNKRVLVGRGRVGARLMDSIHFDAGSRFVRVGPTPLPYAAIHQFGGRAGRGRKVRIPSRPYLTIQKEDKIEILKVINKNLKERLKNG